MAARREHFIYATKVNPRTDTYIRAWIAKNDLTFARAMDYFAYMILGFDTTRPFDGRAGEYNPDYEAYDQAVRAFMEKNTPEDYRRYPLLRRLFGHIIKPLTQVEIDQIEEDLKRNGEIDETDEPPL